MMVDLMNYKKLGGVVCGAMALSLSNALAEEYTIELGELEHVIKVKATAMPAKVLPIKISPQAWKDYKINSFVTHGTTVKKGDTLIEIDTEVLDEKIIESTQSLVKEKLMLEQAELKLTDFKLMTEESLAEAKLKYNRFEEDYKRYIEVVKPVQISEAEYGVTRATQSLSYSQEELDQLLKMYEEDGLTEETEEIILQRVKNSIIANQRGLDRAKRNEKHEKEVQVLRADADWQTKSNKEKRTLEYAQKTLPLKLKTKELEVEQMERDLAKSEKALNKLKSDRALMNIVSPADGVIYYGEFKDGKWNAEVAKKAIRVGGKISAEVVLMSVVPEDSKLIFSAFFSEKQKAQLGESDTGSLRLETQNWKSTPVKVKLASEVPLLSQNWIVSFIPDEDLAANVIIGSKAEVSIPTMDADDILSVPKKAVKVHGDGTFSVSIKMADDEPKETVIGIGRESGDKLEVLSGLENGQVIIIPESKSK